MCVVAVAPLIPLSDAPFLRRLATIAAAFLAGRCAYAAIDGKGEWGLAVLATVLAAASLANWLTWRQVRT